MSHQLRSCIVILRMNYSPASCLRGGGKIFNPTLLAEWLRVREGCSAAAAVQKNPSHHSTQLQAE